MAGVAHVEIIIDTTAFVAAMGRFETIVNKAAESMRQLWEEALTVPGRMPKKHRKQRDRTRKQIAKRTRHQHRTTQRTNIHL